MITLIVCADARNIPLPDESVQCVVTSPPYHGLRKYAGNQDLSWADGWRGAYGLEPTVEMYVAHTVEILREVRRVLRADGVCFWNVGDSYAGSGKGLMGDGTHSAKPGEKQFTDRASKNHAIAKPKRLPSGNGNRWGGGNVIEATLKPKDLCLIPMRVALAAQADGWWVRSVIVWAKPNPMPESVTDRPTDAYEHILMLTKSANYFWDAHAVREGVTGGTHNRGTKLSPPSETSTPQHVQVDGKRAHKDFCKNFQSEPLSSRNLRNVWTFATQPFSGAHFATFPEELPRRCILAATSAKGACRFCGAPWERVVDRSVHPHPNRWSKTNDAKQFNQEGNGYGEGGNLGVSIETKTIGWRPTCECRDQHGKTNPCVCLDPFGGSGTTGRVAIELNRRAVLLDLAYGDEYAPLAEKRTSEVQVNLF